MKDRLTERTRGTETGGERWGETERETERDGAPTSI